MIKKKIDMRSQKINIEKAFDDKKEVEKSSEFIQKTKDKYGGFVTLLDLATEWID